MTEVQQVTQDPLSRTLFVPVSEVFLPQEQPRDHRRSSSDDHIPVLNQEHPSPVLPDDPEWQCRICGTPLTSSSRQVLSGCDHQFCHECFMDYLETCINDRKIESLKCPSFGCENVLSDQLLSHILPSELHSKLHRFRRENDLERNVNFRWCPQPDCSGYDLAEPKRKRLVCSVCSFVYCFYCLEAWHENGVCRSESDRKLDKWAKFHHAKFCPKCKIRVQKLRGCNHMTCVKCQYEWCWLCGDHYIPQHYDTCPVKRMLKRNPPWKYVFLCLFVPIIAPFFLIIGSFIFIEKKIANPNRSCCVNFLRKRCLSYPVLGTLALILTPLTLVLALLLFFVVLLAEFGRYWRYDRNWLGAVARRRCLWILLCLVVGISLSPVSAFLLAAIILLAPFLALFFILQKLVIAVIRCCQPDFMKLSIVPGYAIG